MEFEEKFTEVRDQVSSRLILSQCSIQSDSFFTSFSCIVGVMQCFTLLTYMLCPSLIYSLCLVYKHDQVKQR